jgi:4-amino-4-deoxy-L-arabinose transferase-like glycosyltransferase
VKGTESVSHRSGPSGVLAICVAALVLIVAVFQNFYRLSLAPILSDEPSYSAMGWLYSHWGSIAESAKLPSVSNFEHPPFAKMLFGAAQVLLGHESNTAARAVSAICTLGAAALLAWWLGRMAGRWIGVLAGGMLALIPMAVDPQLTRFGRTAMLDPVAELFMLSSVVVTWFWFRSAGRRSWWLALLAGVCVGIATASKENGFLGAIGPIVLGMVLAGRPIGRLGGRIAQAAVACLAAVLVFVGCYLPFGDVIGRIEYLVRFQSEHSSAGHLVGFAGRVSTHPAWWANFWFAGHGLGTILSWTLATTALAAVILRRDRLVWWCVASLVAPFVFHCFVASVVLPFYWVMWMPAVISLSALGTGELVTRGMRASSVPGRVGPLLIAAIALLGVVVPSFAESVRVAGLQREGASLVADLRTNLGLHGSIVTAGTYRAELQPFLGSTPQLTAIPPDLRGVDTVLLGQPRCPTLIDRGVRALVQANLRLGTLREVHSDRLLRVYVASRPLHAPTSAEIERQPQGHLADNC